MRTVSAYTDFLNTMFRHKRALISTSVVLLLFATTRAQSNSRSYDTNDWIPVSRSCPTCAQNEGTQSEGTQKRPTGRVLNLPTSDQKRFFPSEQSDSSPQSYNIPLKQQEEKQQSQQQARLLQNQGQYPQPQIVLPPQLQSLINQGQPFLSPQRINNQLLQSSNGVAYQPTLQTVPQFALNSTQFNTRDVVQNINLGLYNQQATKQQPQLTQTQNIKQNGNGDREEVQLLYVPLENLRQRGQRQQIAFPNEQRLPTAQAYNQPIAQQYQPVQHKQAQLQNIQQDFVQQALQAQKLQEQFQHNVSPVPQQNFRRPYVPDPITHEPTSTPTPKKRKPHQPPLAVYMGTEGHSEVKLGDVLSLLKNAKTISVQDNIGPDAPQVFVGPSHLAPPEGYVKFDLPYLSSIENNRVERKVDQLPFFVAPLSYKAPPGYSKIPFPAPHVGSVVVNHIQASSQEQTTTENVQHFLNQNIQETNSHIPYSSAEITTVRTRGRQRQPSRASYTASTAQTPVTPEIPYGPLPTKVSPSAEQQHSVQESFISPNPYGPTQFVQSTTPSIYENSASLPQQIFSTKNRFSTPNTNYNVHNVQNIPERHNQFVQQIQQDVGSTEYTPLATTLSDSISDDKYTVLEQFPLLEKSSSNKYSQSNVAQSTAQRVPNRHHSRGRPTENYYNDESKTETPLPLVSNEQYSNEQYLVDTSVKSPFSQNQQEIPLQQYVTQEVPTKQVSLEHYSQDPKQPTVQEPLVQHQYVPQEFPTKAIPLEHYSQQQQQQIVPESPIQHHSAERPHQDEILANQQYSTEQTSTEYEKPIRQSRPHSRVRGKQHFTTEPYYREEYETQNVKETPTRHEHLLNQQVVQHQTPVYDSREQELPISTQATRGRGKPEHTPETYFKEDYVAQNTPVRHEVSLNQQANDQSAEYDSQEIPLQKHQLQTTRERDYDSQEVPLQQVNPQVTRGRGKPQFTPETYRQEYEQHNAKSTESEVHVTNKPIVNYEIPIIPTQKSIELTGRPQYHPETYYRDTSEQPRVQEQQQHQQQYTLPSQLPPISAHLPGLVNSLQDQAIRPLLAPLLLPPSEEPPVTEYTSEYYTTPFTTTTRTTTTTTTTTPAPIVETTTQFKRTRGRQRGTRPTASYEYVNTTPTSRRTSSYRGRRPYTARTRQQSHEENVPVSSTAQPDVVTETSTRAAFNRNRYVQRERQYVSSTTEQPRRQSSNYRQRFRTRGRPLKTDEEYTVRSATENVPDFKQPSLEGGFQASLPIDQPNAELPVQISTSNPQYDIQNDQVLIQKQQEQALVYVQNSNTQTVPESSPIQISSEEYIPREHFISSTEIVEPIHQTTIAASAPENNIVSDVLQNEPVVLVNHKINQQSKYPNVEFNTNRHVEYNSNEDINVNTPRVKYNEEPVVRIQPTTESVRTRSRIRGRPRTRGYQSASTSRYQARSPTTTTTTQRTTTTESKEEDQEFYGFFRPPNFVKPIKMEYKPSSELRTAVNPTPTVAYLHRPTAEEQNVYVSSVGNPVYSTPATHLHVSQVDDNQADPNIRTQYVSSTPSQYEPPTESSEEEVVDIKPVTRRPNISFNKARRPIAPAKVEDQTEIPSRVTEKYYTVRPTKRAETQTPKVTRIRGRIRKPTRPTTVAPRIETESSYSGNQQQQHYSRANELSNTHSDEYVAPVKTRQRITNRGKSHFQLPQSQKIALEPESNNYPPSFLQAQQNQHQQAEATVNNPEILSQKPVNILSAEEVQTAKPSFQLTIEPEDGEEEYADQVPYSSQNKHRIDINLDEGAESKYSAKIVEKPSNYNFIVTDEKSNVNLDKTTEKAISTETIDITTVKNEPVVTETEEPLVTVQQLTTAFPEIDITQSSESTTTDVATTLEPVTDTPQGRRRGVWRLVKLRPVGDDFESAESQNVGTVFTNNYFDAEKPVRKYHSVKRVRTTTEEAEEETTTVVPPKVVNNQQNAVPTPESDIFAPLYEMFGYIREGSILDNGLNILPSDDNTVTTTVLPTVSNISSDVVELTTLSNYNTTEVNQDFSSIKEDKIEMYADRLAKLGDKDEESSTEDSWRTRIIGTSTTTEISHETEICYRGRCIKSSLEESSERL